ncbi:hypothetical protein F4778DRAFT_767823 [Xylariomycetidae sp. FL2044]|nr:hypothetical protein F4778DRAFT_767823 [Xylariomycetidae sp. FL2044]
MSYTDDAVLAKLSSLSETHDSIVNVAQWIMFHRRHAERTVMLWRQKLKDSNSQRRLSLIYLANEVTQQSKARHKEDFLVAFSPAIAEGAATAYKGASHEIQQRIRRVVEVWRERNVFEEPIQVAIENRLQELDKARGTPKANLGGSIFGSSTSSIPSELVPLAAPQQSINKLLLATRTSINSANQDYDKLMGPNSTVPSAPVYAAKLSGLMKSLAQAEGAVEERVNARRQLVTELQRILDLNRNALLSEEDQMETLVTRKTQVEEKKAEVERAIMAGLPNDGPYIPHGLGDHSGAEPDMPEVEALTPPPADPEISENPRGTNGSKKRRLDDENDIPDLGGDGIDADVAEMLRKDSNTSLLRPHPPSPCLSPTHLTRVFYATQPTRQDGEKTPDTREQKSDTTELDTSESSKDVALKESVREEVASAKATNFSASLGKDTGVETNKTSIRDAMSELWRLVRLARSERKSIAFAVSLLLISSGVGLLIPLTVGKVMDASSVPLENFRVYGLNIYEFFGGLAVLIGFGACANFGRIYLLRIIGERVVSRIRAMLYRRIMRQDGEFFDANKVGDLTSRLNNDTVIVGKSITQNVSDGMRSIISGVAGLVALITISPKLTSVLLVAAPLLGTSSFVYARIIRRLSRNYQSNVGTLTKIAEQRLNSVKTVQTFVGESQEVRRFNKQVRVLFGIGKKNALFDAVYFSNNGFVGNLTILALLWFGGDLVRTGAMTIGDLTTYMMYAAFTGSGLFGISSFFSELMKGVGAASRLFELQDRTPKISPTKGLKIESALGAIKFENVEFAYPTRPKATIFNGLNFEIPAGSNVCIVGPSGGGKSSIASLLLRRYNLQSGTIFINGMDIAKVNATSLRKRIGQVEQEPVLFPGTIRENIMYGKPKATEAEIIAAARKSNSLNFILEFPNGFDTQVGSRGAQLSGGQKQRIAIARALITDPDILILDEATSALDAESEASVNQALAGLLHGRSTTISIAHRLSTIRRSNQIIVLGDDGRVAEVGTFLELNANKNSAFSKLMALQTGLETPRIGAKEAEPEGEKKEEEQEGERRV